MQSEEICQEFFRCNRRMEQPEHRKNAGEITALVNCIIDAAIILFFNTNHTAFFKETK